MKEKIVKKIIENYHVGDNSQIVRIAPLVSYPHMFRIEFPEKTLIAKQMSASRLYCTDFDNVYQALSNSQYVEIPLMTKNGNYTLNMGEQLLFLYRELQEINIPPSPIWWAECLASIHTLDEKDYFEQYFSQNIYHETVNLFNIAQPFIEPRIRAKMAELLSHVDSKIITSANFTICHNDPYNKNVMQKDGKYHIIDTESMGLSPKEFDLQRLLHNYVISLKNEDEVIAFWHYFKNEYEHLNESKINQELLKSIYLLDIIRSMSWLYTICSQIDRDDLARQSEALREFNESISCDVHKRILKKI